MSNYKKKTTPLSFFPEGQNASKSMCLFSFLCSVDIKDIQDEIKHTCYKIYGYFNTQLCCTYH